MAKILAPIVVDLGKAGAKKLKELNRGQGALLEDVQEAIAQLRANLGAEAGDKRFLPVVVVYRKKRPGRFLKIPLPI